MKVISLLVAVVIIFFLIFSYFKTTKKVFDENVPGSDSRIEHTRKAVDDINKATGEQQKAVEKLLDK